MKMKAKKRMWALMLCSALMLSGCTASCDGQPIIETQVRNTDGSSASGSGSSKTSSSSNANVSIILQDDGTTYGPNGSSTGGTGSGGSGTGGNSNSNASSNVQVTVTDDGSGQGNNGNSGTSGSSNGQGSSGSSNSSSNASTQSSVSSSSNSGSQGTGTGSNADGMSTSEALSNVHITVVLDGNGQVASANMTCRVIQNDGQKLLLAGEDAGEVYFVTADMAGVAAALQVGSKVKVTWDGLMQENSYPAQLGALKTITAVEGEFNDLCAVYLKVLEDLWNTDTKLNSNLSALGVDLSGTSLSAGERGAVAWAFGQAHGLPTIQGTLQELASSGYIKENAWKGGCLFTITEKSTAGKKLTFDAQKWASSSGSDSFNSCTTTQASDGRWSSYQIGSQTNKTS